MVYLLVSYVVNLKSIVCVGVVVLCVLLGFFWFLGGLGEGILKLLNSIITVTKMCCR